MITKLKDFLDNCPSAYHAVAQLKTWLEGEGYSYLSQEESWELMPGGKYYTTKGDSMLAAFRIPEQITGGFMIAAAHCDFPGFRVKGELKGKYNRLDVERYGGAILSSWMDRPLSVAGRVLVQTEEGVESRLVDIDRDLLLIPNVAIHMDRKQNETKNWNPAVDLLPLAGLEGAEESLQSLLEEKAGGEILGQDLFLYVRDKARVWGEDNALICAQGLDDLQSVFGCTEGFLRAKTGSSVPVLCIFDSEEVGSCSPQGAASTVLARLLERICAARGVNPDSMLAKSLLLSADNAHGIHPNHPEYADPKNAPVLGGGVVLKFNANLRYTTDGLTGALVKKLCQRANVPVQEYWNRADLVGGSTLGCVSLGQVSIPSADIGLAQLAMHSAWETASVRDTEYMAELMCAFFATALELPRQGCYCLKTAK